MEKYGNEEIDWKWLLNLYAVQYSVEPSKAT